MAAEFIQEAYRIHVERSSEKNERLKLIDSELKELRQRRQALLEVIETTGAADVASIVLRISQYDKREQALLLELEKTSAQPDYPEPKNKEIGDALGTVDN